MNRLLQRCWEFASDQRGTETLEWGLVCGLIVVGSISAIALIGPKIATVWNNINNAVQATP